MAVLTITPEPNHVPPRVKIEYDLEDATRIIDQIEFRRDGELLRVNGTVGDSKSVAYDYEAPFGVLSTYTVAGESLELNVTSTSTKTWSDFSLWTGATDKWTAHGGYITSTETEGNNAIYRTFNTPIIKAEIRGGSTEEERINAAIYFEYEFIPGFWTASSRFEWLIEDKRFDLEGDVYDAPTDPVLSKLDTYATPVFGSFAGTTTTAISQEENWSITVPALAFPTRVAIIGYQKTVDGETIPARVNAVKFYLGTLINRQVFVASETVTFEVDNAWLIHPFDPSLSIEFDDQADCRNAGVFISPETAQDLTRTDQQALYLPTQAERYTNAPLGIRLDESFTLVLTAASEADRIKVRSLIKQQYPLFLNFPPSLNWGIPTGWYVVGDVNEERLTNDLTFPTRRFVLPLEPANAPGIYLTGVAV